MAIIKTIDGVKVTISQDNPYSDEWYCIDENYDAETDEAGHWHALGVTGVGNTPDEALEDYLDQMENI